MNASFNGNKLKIQEHEITFLEPIDKILEVENGVVVMLRIISMPAGRNVFFVNLDGTIRWQIEGVGTFEQIRYAGYSWIGFNDQGQFEAFSTMGLLCKIDLKTGAILERKAEK